MGMYAQYWRISPHKWRQIAKDTEAADTFFGYDLDDENDNDGWIAYMQSLENSGRYLDIQKAWEGLHFLLTGNADVGRGDASASLSYVVGGGAEHEWEDDYGSVLYITPARVRKAAQALQTLSHDVLRPRLDAEKFKAAEIYSRGSWGASEMEWMLDAYDEVTKFFHAAAETGDMILVSIG